MQEKRSLVRSAVERSRAAREHSPASREHLPDARELPPGARELPPDTREHPLDDSSCGSMKPPSAQLRALAKRDPRLADAMKRCPAFPGFPAPVERRRTHFCALARSIVYQQLAGKAAATIHGRLIELTPGPRVPRPEEILELSDDALRGVGLSRAKLASLRDLSERITSGELSLHGIGRLQDDDVIERLITVRGIGVWTAQMFLMFRLGRLDVMPTGDLGVQEGLRKLDGLRERPSPAELEERAEAWKPLRSVAAWMCWRLLEVD